MSAPKFFFIHSPGFQCAQYHEKQKQKKHRVTVKDIVKWPKWMERWAGKHPCKLPQTLEVCCLQVCFTFSSRLGEPRQVTRWTGCLWSVLHSETVVATAKYMASMSASNDTCDFPDVTAIAPDLERIFTKSPWLPVSCYDKLPLSTCRFNFQSVYSVLQCWDWTGRFAQACDLSCPLWY